MSKHSLYQDNKSHIPRRLNLLFLVAFVSFAILFARLAHLQLYSGQHFDNMVKQTESTVSTGSVPRGMMYDRHGKVLVGNQPERAILYTRGSDSKESPRDIANTARELASLIDVPSQDLSERDLKDYFVVVNTDLVNSRLSDEQKYLSGAEAYDAQLSVVTEDDIQYSDAERKIIALFKRMSSAFSLSTISVKNKNVTQEEIARVSEHLAALPGITIGTDWERVYPEDGMLRSILGQVSSEDRGLPSERMKELTARGYAMNDRVGISYLEEQYEDVLRGSKSLHKVVTDNYDEIIDDQVVYEGNSGDNLMLSVDLEFQKKIDAIAEESLKNMDNAGLNDRVYITALNPQNGEVLGIAGKRFEYDEKNDIYNKDKIVDDALGAINTSYGMGSSIKPAMVAMGYKEGVISLDNNKLVDEPLKFQASNEKSSVFNRSGRVTIDDIEALQKSSNTYMIKLAMKMGGQDSYQKDGKLDIDPNTINVMRRNFAEFGLGVPTGIDLPNESSGFSPESDLLVSAIDLSYGQFDLYTPLQLGQFASTIANGGTRYSPRLVKEIRGTNTDGTLGGVKTTIPAHVLNRVQLDPKAMARIQEGMFEVSHTVDGAGRYYFMDYPLDVGSKTGTTEAFYAGPIQYAANKPVTNATFVGYAPFDHPQIAISVVVPYLDEGAWGRDSTKIAHDVFNAYFELQDETKEEIKKYMETFTPPAS